MNITNELLQKFEADFESSALNKAVASAVARSGVQSASLNNEVLSFHNFIFSDQTKRGSITNQKASGRCWMFAALNAARVEIIKKLNLDPQKNFELSQNYTLFFDKLEKANYFLENIIKTVDLPLTSRLVWHLLRDPVQDGGQWAMFSGLLEKYGAVPKYAMKETFHSSNTRGLLEVLTRMLRKNAQLIRSAHEAGKDEAALRAMKEEMMSGVYAFLVKCLGKPPKTFDFSYRDKEDKFFRDEKITPKAFFDKYVGWKLSDKVSLINAPTADKPYGKTYTVKFLASVNEASPICYLNVPSEVLKEAAIKSIKAGEAVWFGCDVGQMSERKLGIMDKNMYNYSLVAGMKDDFSKAERLDYGESQLTHAMVFTGVDLDKNGKPIKWQVENSWGEDVGEKGIFSMSDEWFDEYNYQIMVDKKYVDEKWLAALKEKPVELEPWDPMGALA